MTYELQAESSIANQARDRALEYFDGVIEHVLALFEPDEVPDDISHRQFIDLVFHGVNDAEKEQAKGVAQ